MVRIVLLGAGNVATHLFEAFLGSEEIQVVQVYNHSSQSLKDFENRVPATTSLTELAEADIYLIALKDDLISEISEEIKQRNALVAHTSGSVAMDALAGNRKGVFYPLQTFSKTKKLNYQNIPFCVEANNPEDLELLKKIAAHVSGKAFEVDSHQRKRLHLSAVFVCNFVNHLYGIGEDICRENDLPFEILQPLIRETAEKIEKASPSEVQTGPAIRNDQSTIEKHLQLISSEENKEIYNLLTKAIQSKHGKKL